MGPRVVDSFQKEVPVVRQEGDKHPLPPEADGDGTIFISLASYRGTCLSWPDVLANEADML